MNALYFPLYFALRRGHLEIVQLLLDHGAGVTIQANGLTPYQIATQNGHHGVMQLLLGHGAERVRGQDEDRSTNSYVPPSEEWDVD